MGFLSGGREKSFHLLSAQEQASQKEEAYARDAYLENMHMSTFLLTSRRIRGSWSAHGGSVSEVGSNANSGKLEVSDNSSTDSKCTDMEASSIACDQNRFDTAYKAFQNLANDLYYIDLRRHSRGSTSENELLDGYENPQEMVHLPRTWPLARLTFHLKVLASKLIGS